MQEAESRRMKIDEVRGGQLGFLGLLVKNKGVDLLLSKVGE